MEQPVTPEKAQQVFDAMAARGHEIAFRWLTEGCECRAQIMIEHIQAMGLLPGRAWAISVGRKLAFPDPNNPRYTYKWENHVAPTLAVAGVECGVVVIDPSLSQTGPLTLAKWAEVVRARAIEVSNTGLPQKEILSLQTARALEGRDLDAMVFYLKLGEAPIPEAGGSGFRIGPDPPQGPSQFSHEKMKEFLAKQRQWRPTRP
jgi:hypothetical protein